jgi:DNA-binding transcriptional ArsR family regulator
MKTPAVSIFRALGNSTRLKIVLYLLQNGEAGCQKISERFPLSQPTLSHHFAKLTDADLLSVRREGALHFYSINEETLARAGVSAALLKRFYPPEYIDVTRNVDYTH